MIIREVSPGYFTLNQLFWVTWKGDLEIMTPVSKLDVFAKKLQSMVCL